MNFILTILSAIWMGILTSISPCPLTTNIAAISFVAKKMNHPKKVLFAGIIYSLGRMVVYSVLGIIIVFSLISTPILAHTLQKYMNLFLGPLLIIVGMVLLEMININFFNQKFSQNFQKKFESSGFLGAFLLGILFALSFCPVTAAIFFGSLIPIAIKYQSAVILPSVYGFSTGLPVLFFAFFISLGMNRLGFFFNQVVLWEKWARKITGTIFILLGIYLSLEQIL